MAFEFNVTTMTPKQKVEFLDQVCQKTLLHPEKVQSLYLVMGDDLFFMLAMLAGDDIRFPPQRVLRKIYLTVTGQTRENADEQG
jgi:hypothetical protein